MLLYRISKSNYAQKLSASGRQNRWNTEDRYILYTASSLSLACLETIVHTSAVLLFTQDFKRIIIEIPDDVAITNIDVDNLPKNWKEREQKSHTQQIGDEWNNKQKTLLLRVPSAIIHTEFNYLVNTKHPDFNKANIAEVDSFMFDKRIKE